jgi:hypothetical protein
MPGVLWFKEQDHLQRRYESKGQVTQNPAEITIARELDRALDKVLDEAVDLKSRVHDPRRARNEFTAAWAVGSVLRESRLSEHKALKDEDDGFLWEVLAEKSWVEARSDGTKEDAWESIRPARRKEKVQRHGGAKGDDYWSMCRWLAEQSYADAVLTFGGQVGNVWQMLERTALRPLPVRKALCGWLGDLSEEGRGRLTHRKVFRELMKALRKRWPARGRRSALQPIHLGIDELRAEIAKAAWEAGILATTRDST